jgi:RNA polymerase sigma-70 factor (ECF subfamily)
VFQPASPDQPLNTPDPLRDMMKRVATGDRVAFAALYKATASKLLGVLLRITKERSRAEDILQDVYVRVWERSKDYDPERGAPLAWLIIMARSRALDDLRRRKRFVSTEVVAEIENIASEEAHPLDRREEEESDTVLARCLAGLEQMKKEMILLAYQHGMSREELAQRFNTPVATIKTWLRRSLDSLRLCLSSNV